MPRAVGQPAHVSFRGMPTPMVRDSLRALARSGRPVTWSAAELDTIAVSAERQREPGAPVRITVAATGLTEPSAPLALVIRNPDGTIAGGLSGISYYNWLFIEFLVLPKPLRGQGLGTQLMHEAETIARGRGLTGIWLDTFSFQAPEFYQKLGYTVFGEIQDYPPGQSRFYLSKRLKFESPPPPT